MSSTANRQIVLRRRPETTVTDDCFQLIEAPLREPSPGEVQVRTLWLSFDPAQRGWLNDVPSYVPPVELGAPMRSYGIGEVLASSHPSFDRGDLVYGFVGWQDYAVGDPGPDGLALDVLPADLSDPKLALGPMGMTGLTAYFGMCEIGRVGPGDVVLVTAAAGATGSVAGQIARLRGAHKVVGTAGSDDKRRWVVDVAGFDSCVDHYEGHLFRRLGQPAPDGYDVVFDNVGGELLDAALGNVALHGRIALCGSISTGYRPGRPEVGLRNYQLLTTRRARMEGFLVSDFNDRFAEARAALHGWIAAGHVRTAEDVVEGLEHAPATLRRLFDGRNLGKQILHVADQS
jgi:NADPH-dependent curcumin reductase CurA